jgi:hypothetical protein
MLHAKAMAVIVAEDIYKELAEGKVDLDWKVTSLWTFIPFVRHLPDRCFPTPQRRSSTWEMNYSESSPNLLRQSGLHHNLFLH